jgi:hypothetical protein
MPNEGRGNDTPRDMGSPEKSTEAEPERRMYPRCSITLHDASMAVHMIAALQKVNGGSLLVWPRRTSV